MHTRTVYIHTRASLRAHVYPCTCTHVRALHTHVRMVVHTSFYIYIIHYHFLKVNHSNHVCSLDEDKAMQNLLDYPMDFVKYPSFCVYVCVYVLFVYVCEVSFCLCVCPVCMSCICTVRLCVCLSILFKDGFIV